MSNILSIRNLRKTYGHIVALDDLSLEIKKGNVYGLLGPNGSGKTTTLSIILGLISQNSGEFNWFENTDLQKAKKQIGSLIESPHFYPYLSIEKNLKIAATIKGIPESDIDRVLNIVNLAQRKKSRYDNLSFGMKQRLALASLLLGDPEVLILDEPTNGLDPEGIAEVRSIIKAEAAKNKTVIMASHILDEVEKVCSHVAILKKGKLIANGRVSELLNSDEQIIISTDKVSELYELLVREGIAKRIEKKDYEIILTLDENKTTAMLNEFAIKHGHILTKIEVHKKTLEAQFLELVK